MPPGDPLAVTHVWRSRGAAEANFVKAVASLRVGAAGHQTHPGLQLVLSAKGPVPLVEPRFRGAVLMQATTSGWLGSDADAIDHVNVVTFRTMAPVRPMPPGAKCEVHGQGFILHAAVAGEPAKTSVRTLAMTLREPEATRAISSPSQVGAPPVQRTVPNHVAALRMSNLDETAPILNPIKVADVLPFSGSTGDETLQALAKAPLPAANAGFSSNAASPDETVMLPPNARAPGGPGMPFLSLEQYAELRAHLLVFGENHEPTLLRFGLLTQESRELLKLRFLAIFAADEVTRDRFVVRMQELATQLRSKSGSPK
jgi:hypothetical protein